MPKSYSLEPQSNRRVQVVKTDQSEDNDILYIDDLKVFAASESKLWRVLKSVIDDMLDMECVGLKWNEKKRTVVHVKKGCLN